MLRKIMCLLVVAVLLGIGSAQGAIVEDGSSFTIDLNDGAFITNNAAPSNTFSANDLINMYDGEVTSDPFPLSKIPVVTVGGNDYFQFIYDMQETGKAETISIDDIVVTALGVMLDTDPVNIVVWDYDQAKNGSIVLNPMVLVDGKLVPLGPPTATPLGAGGDMALYVPVSAFQGYGLTGSSLLTMTVTQSVSDNGDDEWVVLGPPGFFFGPDDSIDDGTPAPVVPEPATLAIWSVLGVAGLALRRFKAA